MLRSRKNAADAKSRMDWLRNNGCLKNGPSNGEAFLPGPLGPTRIIGKYICKCWIRPDDAFQKGELVILDAGKPARRCIQGVGSGFMRRDDAGVRAAFVVRCGRWDCPTCGPRQGEKVQKRVLEGEIWRLTQAAGYDQRYLCKLLTLTVPGKEYRANCTPEQAYRELQEGWRHVVQCLRMEDRGEWEYFRVVEPQQDGFPHLHIILAGPGIRDREVFARIMDLWRNRYGMGFGWINAVRKNGRYVRNQLKNAKQMLRYAIKYLCKGGTIELPKKGRRYTAGTGALEPARCGDKLWSHLTFRWGCTDLAAVVADIARQGVENVKATVEKNQEWWEEQWTWGWAECPF
jgi:hypothetical protein